MIIDYAHNVPGMQMLGDFVDKTAERWTPPTTSATCPGSG